MELFPLLHTQALTYHGRGALEPCTPFSNSGFLMEQGCTGHKLNPYSVTAGLLTCSPGCVRSETLACIWHLPRQAFPLYNCCLSSGRGAGASLRALLDWQVWVTEAVIPHPTGQVNTLRAPCAAFKALLLWSWVFLLCLSFPEKGPIRNRDVQNAWGIVTEVGLQCAAQQGCSRRT